MEPPASTPKRSQRSRTETMNLLRAATLELLETINPNDLTIRDIADRAGVYHRYVPDYFGGKAELLANVYPTVQAQAAEGISPLDGDTLRPEIIRLAHLAVWLSQHRDGGVPTENRAIMKQLKSTFTTGLGLDDTTSALLAQRLMAGVITIAAFPDVVSEEPVDIAAHRALELKLLQLLVQDAQQHNTPEKP